MYQMGQISWEEDDFKVPDGVKKMGHSIPNCGKTYLMYHGTSQANAHAIRSDGFRQSQKGMLGPGVYLSRDLNKASRYPLELAESERVVLRVKVNVGNVIAINYKNHPRQYTWHDAQQGPVFDTAWCPPNCGMTKSGLEEDCVWDPQRIEVVDCIYPKQRGFPSGYSGYSAYK
ncbi:unnamed protein product [Merluccius merluccius]